ncbi:MAG: CRISPR-associated endonuclease Cas2 [Spirosomataceae bacterium]
MLYLIAYDIEHNRSRTKMADWLLDLGLQRVQLSVFMGNITDPDLLKTKEVVEKLRGRQESDAAFDVMLLPLAEAHTENVLWHGENVLAWDLILDKRLTWIV